MTHTLTRPRLAGSLVLLLGAASASATLPGCGGSSSSVGRGAGAPPTNVVRMGAATSPKYGAVFDAMKRDFERQGHAFEYTLYQDYFDLGDAFFDGEVDVAWNTPQGHARAVLRSGGRVLGPIARDVDIQYTAHVVVRKDSGIDTIQDLVGKTFCLGSSESAECYDVPRYYLRQEGLDIEAQCVLTSLDGLVDLEMNDRSTANDVLDAITAGQVHAGAVGEKSTRALRADPTSPLKVIWVSPPFTHCIFTTHADYHPGLLSTFRTVLLSEHMNDPIGREVLVNEGNDRIWVDSANERDSVWGFEALVASIRGQPLTRTRPAGLVIRIGAVCTTPQIASFRALARYFRKAGEPNLVYVLYGTQAQLDAALHAGKVDLAWNGALAHARALERTNGTALAAVARDTDLATRLHVVVPKGAGIADLADLAGRTLVLGSEEDAALSALPRHLLPAAGLDLSRVTLMSLDGRRDAEWRYVDDAAAVVAAVTGGVGDAGVVDQAVADAIAADPAHPLVVLWSSPPFGGRVVTALDTIDPAVLARFRQVMLGMTLADATGNTVLVNERATAWHVGSNDGYAALRAAIVQQQLPLTTSR
ncbi:MAG: phosphate/phosphite/phosphonate ABC transporter substrate-binding protein [Planctomycetes bacterium]|nr:phosphate/phosphite/phosphonate ABC transporter substrate-binding protein [Planctomycetota bacterium]